MAAYAGLAVRVLRVVERFIQFALDMEDVLRISGCKCSFVDKGIQLMATTRGHTTSIPLAVPKAARHWARFCM